MRIFAVLILLIIAAAGAYSGYWFYVAERIRGAAQDWGDAREAQGWDVSREGLVVDGFPGAHRIEMTGLEIATPQTQGGWALGMDALRVEAGSPWDLNSWTVRPRSDVRLRLSDGEDVLIAADTSYLQLDSESGAISHFYVEAQALAVTAPTAALRSAETLFVQGDRDSEASAWRVQFEARNAQIAEGAFGNARNAFGGEVAVLALDLQAEEEGLAALAAGGAGLDEAGDLTVNAAHLEWGAAVLSGQGAVGVDPLGRLRGNFDVAVADPAAFLGALAGGGVLDARQANVALAAASFFPRDEDDRIVLPFNFRDGDTRLGPVAIGRSPLIRGRGAAPPPAPALPPTPAPVDAPVPAPAQ